MKTGAEGGGGLPAQQRGKKNLSLRGEGMRDTPVHDQESTTLQPLVPNAAPLCSLHDPRKANVLARNVY